MEAQHQIRSAGRFDAPLADDGRRGSTYKERPGQTNYSFAGADTAAGGVARRQHHQIGLEIQIHYLPTFQEPVFPWVFWRLRQNDIRIHRISIIENPMGGEL